MNKNEIIERARANVEKIEESKAALEERRLLNAMHPEWMKYEPAPKTVPDVVYKERKDALESSPCGCNEAPGPAYATHEDLDTVIQVCGEGVGELEKRLMLAIAELKKLIEKNNDR